ncbi:diphthine--ammonia ligase [Thermodesulfovibrio yellowstonii]|uniref:ATP pyrophosphatase n=1 Tax=Thermodesulfovibrio yellowstonii TaxID=28262 RepID=A0A9W6GGI9_9BACT|nr:diphthine--ammonia ligase [Thermodesulfovibrio islandicus]GLI53740.1 ATP pyrophosphatase [Thermodesulfovibrio islandicus]
MDILKSFISWSGGKDSSLACYRAMTKGVQVVCLVNMLSEDGIYSRSHGIGSELLRLQAEAIGIPIIQRKTTWESYEKEFKNTILQLKKEDIKAGVFGDIDLQEHRDWVERVCRETGIKVILPLWNEEREKLLKEFIDLGFKAIVCSTNSEFLGKEWLGRQIDDDFIKDLKDLGNIDICGEKGEYHTFVYDGPIFKKAVKFRMVDRVIKDGKWFLKIERE